MTKGVGARPVHPYACLVQIVGRPGADSGLRQRRSRGKYAQEQVSVIRLWTPMFEILDDRIANY